ncbi:MAG: dTMP kinase [Rhizobiaceae bacterium]
MAISQRLRDPFAASKKQRPARKGLFITFEGGEGAGKSSQIKRLAEKLKELGHDIIVTREPGGSPGAEAVRHVLLSGAAEKYGTEMEAILFSAARSDHVDTVIKPALAADKTVLCDRFMDSSRVYQGITGNVDITLLGQLESVACEDAWPDLTIVLDVPIEVGMKRATARRAKSEAPDRYEKESLELQDLRRQGYLSIAKSEPGRCVVVDGDGTPAQVFKRLWSAVEERLGDKLIPKRPKRRVGRATKKP